MVNGFLPSFVKRFVVSLNSPIAAQETLGGKRGVRFTPHVHHPTCPTPRWRM